MHTFTPPSTEYSYASNERLWQFFRSSRHGISVIRWVDGTYTAVETVTTDEFDEASFIYLGGHIYRVSDAEADALTAAGFGAGLTADVAVTDDIYTALYELFYGLHVVPGPPPPPYDPPPVVTPPPDGGGDDSGFGSSGFGSSGFGG